MVSEVRFGFLALELLERPRLISGGSPNYLVVMVVAIFAT